MPDNPTRPRARGLAGAAALVTAFTAAPVAGYLDHNREEITGVATVARLGAVSVGLALVALAATLLIARRSRPAPAGAAVAAVAFVFFQWPDFRRM